jgi:hypothetical protein
MLGKKPHKVAELEAFQEAGVKGIIGKKPIGVYPYTKILPDRTDRICLVEVYPLRVTLETAKWRERRERKRVWFRWTDAAEMVDEGGLRLIIAGWR